MGYRTVTASDFFNVTSVAVVGAQRSSQKEVERIVAAATERTGAWNADLAEIKQKIERVAFVKTAAVSQMLPNGIRVDIIEREPKAIVRFGAGDFLVDAEGQILSSVEGNEENLPFAMTGWDQAKTEKAFKENLERIRMYQKMAAEWRDQDLANRVRTVDLTDLREPRAITEDSGTTVSIQIGRDDFRQHLVSGIKAIANKGNIFEAVNLSGENMILAPRKTPAAAPAKQP